MSRDSAVFVVIPAHDEEDRIARTIGCVPGWVRGIVVVDDASSDRTSERAAATQDPRLVLVRHERNSGVGRAIATGYQRALALGAEQLVVMAGDAQMDPADLPALLGPLVSGDADYVKGNRFLHPERKRMPRLRRWGSRTLGLVTRGVSGLDIDDSQCGYTALDARAARLLDLDGMWPRYGYPNDLLIQLGRRGLVVSEVPVRPVYQGEKSGLRAWHMLGILFVVARRALLERRRAGRRGPLARAGLDAGDGASPEASGAAR